MTSAPPHGALEVEESTAHHWVAWVDDLVIVFVYEGSDDDVAHVAAATRVVERLHRKLRLPLRMLFVIPEMLGKAPTARVRAAIMESGRRLHGTIARVSLAVLGTGFGPALHRSAATGVLTLLRPQARWKIHASVHEALRFLLDEGYAGHRAIAARCDEELLAHAERKRPASMQQASSR